MSEDLLKKFLEIQNYLNLEKIAKSQSKDEQSILQESVKDVNNLKSELKALRDLIQQLYHNSIKGIIFDIYRIVDQIGEASPKEIRDFVATKYGQKLFELIKETLEKTNELTDKEFLYKTLKSFKLIMNSVSLENRTVLNLPIEEFEHLHDTFYDLYSQYYFTKEDKKSETENEVLILKIESHSFFKYHQQISDRFAEYPTLIIELMNISKVKL